MNKFLLAILLLSSSVVIAAESFSPLDSKLDKSLISTDDSSNFVYSGNDSTGDADNTPFTFQFIAFSFYAKNKTTFHLLHQENKTNSLLTYSLIPRAPPFI